MSDEIIDKYNEQLGVLVTSHPMQHIWMHQGFASWAGYQGFMLLGYDNCDIIDLPLGEFMPPVCETFVTGHCAGELGHYKGELWQMKLGGLILAERGYKYIYKTAADNCCYRWRNLKQIFKVLLGKPEYDMIICGTTQIFARLDAFNRCMELWSEKITKCGGAECFLNHRIKDLEIRDLRNKVPWWNEILGLVHLQGEYAVNNGLSIIDTWAIGRKWGRYYKHADLAPRIKFLKPYIRERYEKTIPKDQEDS
jgi:hypothetical protein